MAKKFTIKIHLLPKQWPPVLATLHRYSKPQQKGSSILKYKPATHCHWQMDLKEVAKGSTACPSDLAAAEGGQALPQPGEAGTLSPPSCTMLNATRQESQSNKIKFTTGLILMTALLGPVLVLTDPCQCDQSGELFNSCRAQSSPDIL